MQYRTSCNIQMKYLHEVMNVMIWEVRDLHAVSYCDLYGLKQGDTNNKIIILVPGLFVITRSCFYLKAPEGEDWKSCSI